MGRKHAFMDENAPELTAVNSAEPGAPEAVPAIARHLGSMGKGGAIGAVTRSIEQMRANAVVELAPALIDASAITDRLPGSPEDLQPLVDSIREHGQQVPILVRPHPDREGRYQIAYGRRRLRALTELGRPVRAIVRPLTDQQLVVAQGQENTARTDLSFIEKALFAAKLEQGGFDRETIMASLSVDKTTLSRLISAALKIPAPIIEAIGPAPGTGRDRWIELATRLETPAQLDRAQKLIEADGFSDKASDDRFAALFSAAAPRTGKPARAANLKAADGTRLARIKEDEASLTLALDKKALGGFAAHLVETLPDIYAAFKRRGDQSNQRGKDEEQD